MNLIILVKDDFVSPTRVHIHDHRLEHVYKIHKAQVGDSLNVGLLDGLMGSGTLISIDKNRLVMEVDLTTPPPPALPLTLVLALPRPNMLKRSLQTCATMGVKKIILINSQRVEKSFWQSPQLSEDNIHKHLLLGLEQGKDTHLPKVSIEKNFNYFITNTLAELTESSMVYLAHPHAAQACPHSLREETSLIIGPEGGFITKEVEQLEAKGCKSIHIGKRILRVETAIPVLLSKLFY